MLTSLFADLSPALVESISAPLTDAIQSVFDYLSDFARREDFWDKSESMFGQTLDHDVLSVLRQQWIAGDFSGLPDLKLLSGSDLQGANATFAGSTGEIYLSERFLSQYVGSPQVLAAVLLEEVGHSVDWQVNAVDTPGDEGELFSNIVRGENLSSYETNLIKAQDDTGNVKLAQGLIQVEQNEQNPDHDFNAVYNELLQEGGEAHVIFINGINTTNERIEVQTRDEVSKILNLGYDLSGFNFNPDAPSYDFQESPQSPKSSVHLTAVKNASELENQTEDLSEKWNILLQDYANIWSSAYRKYSVLATIETIQDVISFLSSTSDVLDDFSEVSKTALTTLNQVFPQYFTPFTDQSKQVNQNWTNDVVEWIPKSENIIGSFFNVSNSKDSVILLGHSQGNFFFEDGLQDIASQIGQNRLKVIGLGSPTNYDELGLGGLGTGGFNVRLFNDKEGNYVDPVTVLQNSWYFPSLGLLDDVVGKAEKAFLVGIYAAFVESKGLYGKLHDLNQYLEQQDVKNYFKNSIYDLHPQGFYFPNGKTIYSNQISAVGTDDDDWIEGSQYADEIAGLGRNDVIRGREGNDRLLGGTGYDFLDGGSDYDIADYSNFGSSILVQASSIQGISIYKVSGDTLLDIEEIQGSRYDDRLYGFDSAQDVFYGNQGSDRMWGNEASDILHGGDNTLNISKTDLLQLIGTAVSQILGLVGIVPINFLYKLVGNLDSFQVFQKIVDHVGLLGVDYIDGGNGDDKIWGDFENNSNAGASDVILGGNGDDDIFGGGGTDIIYGGIGNDYIRGESGTDIIFGGDGDDDITGGDGDDEIWGWYGDDVIYGDSGFGNDTIYGEYGNDTLYGRVGNDKIYGGDDQDLIYGEEGEDYIEGNTGNDTISGGDNNDFISGGDDNDTITGDSGDDIISGGNDNDRIEGNTGNDQINGDAGDDTIAGNDGSDRILGGSGNDTITGDAGNDLINGNDGNDLINGNDGDDNIFGDAGNDNIYGDAGNDNISGGNDNDNIFGGTGNDNIQGDAGDDTILGGDGNDTIQGNDGNDKISGENGQDLITGNNGDDIINGGNDNDNLFGNDGNDTITGDNGDDNVFGGNGNDNIQGNEGNDKLYGDAGNDLMEGNNGDDFLTGGDGNDTMKGGDGADFLNGQTGNDILYGDAGNDILYGEAGDDKIYGGTGDDYMIGGAGGDILDGGAGNDTVSYYTSTSGVRILLQSGQTFGGDAAGDRIYGTENVEGSNFDDQISGDNGDNKLIGLAGNDSLDGKVGDDKLYGGKGNDNLDGGQGNDILLGGDGNDNLDGSSGDDIIGGGAGDDIVFGGRSGDDILSGGDGNDTINGSAGKDLIFGGNGNDQIDAGSHNDLVDGGAGNDIIYAGSGDDVILGGDGNDTIYADTGNDMLVGGLGNDILYGGKGNGQGFDTFVLSFNSGTDTIYNFQSNQDVIGLFGGLTANQITWTKLAQDTILSAQGQALAIFKGVQFAGKQTPIFSLINSLPTALAIDPVLALTEPTPPPAVGGSAIFPGTDYLTPTPTMPTLGITLTDTSGENGSGDSILNGTSGNDFLFGFAGNDRLSGNDGDDLLVGGSGRDILVGGNGADTFRFDSFTDSLVGDPDQVSAFNQTEGDRFQFLFGNPASVFNAGGITGSNLSIAAENAYQNKDRVGTQLAANEAVFFTWNSNTYLGMNDSDSSFNANADAIVQVSQTTFAHNDAQLGVLNSAKYFA